jgi:hypothetical protein
MKANRLLEKLMDNWPAKIICFVMALFIYVFHQVSLLDKKTFTVPLTITANGALYPMSTYPEYVKVTVRAKPDAIASVLPNEITAVLNLNTYSTEGDYDIPVSLNLSQNLMLMDPFEVVVKPEYVPLTLEQKAEKYIKITPLLSGEPLHGYLVKNVIVTPSTVRMTGPRTMIAEAKEVYTEKIDVSGLETGTVVSSKLHNSNQLFYADNPDMPLRVSFDIEPEPMTKNYTDVAIHPMFLSPHLEIAGQLPVISFELDGTVSVLENYAIDDNTVQIDCSLIQETGNYELPVHFVLPESVQIKNESLDTVKFKVIKRTEDKVDSEVNTEQ